MCAIDNKTSARKHRFFAVNFKTGDHKVIFLASRMIPPQILSKDCEGYRQTNFMALTFQDYVVCI